MLVCGTSCGRVALNTTKLTKTLIRFGRWASLVRVSIVVRFSILERGIGGRTATVRTGSIMRILGRCGILGGQISKGQS